MEMIERSKPFDVDDHDDEKNNKIFGEEQIFYFCLIRHGPNRKRTKNFSEDLKITMYTIWIHIGGSNLCLIYVRLRMTH
jgi:hypothetical protein